VICCFAGSIGGGRRGSGRGGVRRQRPNAFLGVRITDPSLVAGVRAVQTELISQSPSLSSSLIGANRLHITCGLAHLKRDQHSLAKDTIARITPAIQYLVGDALGVIVNGRPVYDQSIRPSSTLSTPTSSSSSSISTTPKSLISPVSLPFAGVGHFSGGRVIYGQPSSAAGVGAWMPSSSSSTTTTSSDVKAATTTSSTGSSGSVGNQIDVRLLIARIAHTIDLQLGSAGLEMIHEEGRSHGSNYEFDTIPTTNDDEKKKENDSIIAASRKFHLTIAKSGRGGGGGRRGSRGGGGGRGANGGDWQCQVCNDGHKIWASKTVCRKCGTPRAVAPVAVVAATPITE
jgi:hypothetical protein